jgi:DNA topoisomerase-1
VTDTVHVYAGDCTATYHGDGDATSQRGRVVVVHKPDGTVLVHDDEGYQPVQWLTRANAVHRERGEDGSFALVAVKDDERLRVESHGRGDHASHDATAAGVPVGTCPDCTGTLAWARGAVTCLDCPTEYRLPGDATVLDSTCGCGLPRMAVERGARFELCVDWGCEGLDEAVRDRFDREWSCPGCDGDLRVLRERTLFLGCENYPDCESSFALPDREVLGTCDCGLPLVDAPDGPHCLDADCDEWREDDCDEEGEEVAESEAPEDSEGADETDETDESDEEDHEKDDEG